jgi:hypothetical protein
MIARSREHALAHASRRIRASMCLETIQAHSHLDTVNYARPASGPAPGRTDNFDCRLDDEARDSKRISAARAGARPALRTGDLGL